MKLVGDKVINHRGDVLAIKAYGRWEYKDREVADFLNSLEEPKKEEPKEELVRARDEDGKFIPDDPATPENEAWVKKVVKRVQSRSKSSKTRKS